MDGELPRRCSKRPLQFSGRAMSDWGLYEIDDVVWDGFEESDDHIVPAPEDAQEGTWTVKGDYRKKSLNVLYKNTEQKPVGNKNALHREKEDVMACSNGKEEPSTQLLDMNPWCDVQDDKQATYNLMHIDSGIEIKSGDRVGGDCYSDIKLGSAENDLIMEICKEDPILQNGDSVLGDREATIMNSSCDFSLTDICPPEADLEFFGSEHEDKNSCSLLEYGWASIGNFEDVDRLLRNCESTMGHAMNSSMDDLLWVSSSSACVDNSPQGTVQQGMASSSPDSRALKGKSQQDELEVEFMPCDNPPILASCEKGDSKIIDCKKDDSISNVDKPFEQQSSGHIERSQQLALNENKCSLEEQRLENSGRTEGTSRSQMEETRFKQLDKANSYRKQTSHKQPEGKHKKHLSDRKPTENMPPVISYSTGFQGHQSISSNIQNSVSSALQVFPSPGHPSQKQSGEANSLRQVYPQVPYIHPGYGYPLHYMPIMPSLPNLRPQSDQSQSLFIGYQLPADVSNQPQHIKKPFEIPSRPPSMTPQEKIEKLRWRQHMQARLAIEHQQQQFGGQNDSMDHSLVNKQPQKNQSQHAVVTPKEGTSKILQSLSVESDSLTPQENSPVASVVTNVDDDGSLEAAVLHQLQNVIAGLDIRTRLCIRGALFRLARSAMQRRCVSDTKNSSQIREEQFGVGGLCISINCDETQTNRCTGVNDMETETNPIDRTIAHLLFHKHSLPSAGTVSTTAGSSESTFSMNTQSLSEAPNPWLCQPPVSESSNGLSIKPTAKTQPPIPVQSLTSMPQTGIGCGTRAVNNLKSSTSGGSCSNSTVIFNRLDAPSASASLRIYNPPVESDVMLDTSEGLTELRCQNLAGHQRDGEIFPPSNGNMVKQEPLESMLVDMMSVDSDVLTSEHIPEIGDTKKRRISLTE